MASLCRPPNCPYLPPPRYSPLKGCNTHHPVIIHLFSPLIILVSRQVAATVVKDLRDKTGAGMMDCKKALAENDGDIEASIEWLRKKGLAGADKKAGR